MLEDDSACGVDAIHVFYGADPRREQCPLALHPQGKNRSPGLQWKEASKVTIDCKL